MKKLSHSAKSSALLALVFSVVAGLNAPITAVPTTLAANSTQESESPSLQPGSNVQLAQGLVGQCRAVNTSTFIRSQPSIGSQAVRALAPNEQVTLADNGNSQGWIAVSAPAVGFVQTSLLKSCTGTQPSPQPTPPPTTSSTCHVTRTALSVRQGPSLSSASNPAGGVASGATIRLANPPERQINAAENNRVWVRIVAPRTGWVSTGVGASPTGNVGPGFACR
ncbi:MAG: SH3 domain-containing protein [Microcoleus sp. SIO2G3]|nr:SH3 domain-containing protein [Microcoleus sp. SIO2G3]